VQQQHAEGGALLRAAEVNRLPTGEHLQRAEDSKLYAPTVGVRVACRDGDVNAFGPVRIEPRLDPAE
jgi:hypothetical protein